MRYISLFSGIEAASCAWDGMGWEPVAFSEIDPFPSAVLAEHYPNVPNLGDITNIDWSPYAGTIDLVVGGSPCQSFSIAGGRESLDGESALCFEYWRAVRDLRPRWFLWENVPGVFSTRDNAFGQFIDALEELGYGMAWRTLDAQFFGVAQRRRRVFLVGSLRGGGTAAAVLFELESVRGNTATSKDKREELAARRGASPRERSGGGLGFVQNQRNEIRTMEVSGALAARPGVKQQTYVLGSTQAHAELCENLAQTQVARQHKDPPVVCMADDNVNASVDEDLAGTLKCGGGQSVASNGRDYVGALTARDYKGVGNEYVQEGKVICQRC